MCTTSCLSTRYHPAFLVAYSLRYSGRPSSGNLAPGAARPAELSPGSSGGSEYESEAEHFEVERIMDMRFSGDTTEYLVRWVGYGAADDTWEPEHHIQPTAAAKIATFFSGRKGKRRRRKT